MEGQGGAIAGAIEELEGEIGSRMPNTAAIGMAIVAAVSVSNQIPVMNLCKDVSKRKVG